ncbi:MAG: hypothetical protein JNK82_09195 [Myxococcaceae bacterium]|nr:hypothetical protein [Myxococcaceae bacterium]
MTKKVGSTPKPVSAAKLAKTEVKKATAKKAAVTKKATGKDPFPRTTWEDGKKLGKELERGRGAGKKHPKIDLAKPELPLKPGGKPPIAMKYGLIRPDPDKPKPPIAMKYGLVRPDPDQPKPPIAMKYGLVRPDPDQPKPPIAMKYGLVRPDDDDTKPPKKK